MTLKDFLKRVDTEDLDKMLLWSDGDKGWNNIKIMMDDSSIYICPDKQCSPFSSDIE